MSETIYKLYFLYEISNGKVFYIGITKRTLSARLSSHIFDSKRKNKDQTWKYKNYHFRKIRKMITNNISFKIELLLDFTTLEEACQAEIKYIKWCKDMGFKLTNSTDGGEGILNFKHSIKTKQKLREANIGLNNPNYGKSPSLETREKQRQKLKGKPNLAWQNPEIRKKMIDGITKNHADVSGKNNPMYGTTGSKSPKAKLVKQFSLDGNFIAQYGSAREAGKITGFNFNNICACASGKKETANGFIWKYE